jgi:hypothetical protein
LSFHNFLNENGNSEEIILWHVSATTAFDGHSLEFINVCYCDNYATIFPIPPTTKRIFVLPTKYVNLAIPSAGHEDMRNGCLAPVVHNLCPRWK